MATYLMDNTKLIGEANLDQVCNNSRNRATSPTNPLGVNWMMGSGATPTSTAPGANNATALVAANLGIGIVVLSPTAAALTFTTDSAVNIIQYMQANSAGVMVGDVLQCLIVNGSANSFTVGFGAGVTKDTNVSATMPANTSRMFYFRVSNNTIGSEAVTAYY